MQGRFTWISFSLCKAVKGSKQHSERQGCHVLSSSSPSSTPAPPPPPPSVHCTAWFTGPGFWHGSGLLTQKPKVVVLPGQGKGWHQPGSGLVDRLLEVLGHSAKCSGDFGTEAMAVKWSTQRRERQARVSSARAERPRR